MLLTTSRWCYGQILIISHMQLFSSSAPYENLDVQGCICNFSKEAATFLYPSLASAPDQSVCFCVNTSAAWILFLDPNCKYYMRL